MLDTKTKILNENVLDKNNYGYYEEETEPWLGHVMRGEGLWKLATEEGYTEKGQGRKQMCLLDRLEEGRKYDVTKRTKGTTRRRRRKITEPRTYRMTEKIIMKSKETAKRECTKGGNKEQHMSVVRSGNETDLTETQLKATHTKGDYGNLTYEAHPRPSSVFWYRTDLVDGRHLVVTSLLFP